MELTDLRGVGKSRLDALHAAGIVSLRDLLYAIPYKYKDLSRVSTVADAPAGERVTLRLTREGPPKLTRFGKSARVQCAFADGTGMITAWWFNQPWMKKNLDNTTSLTLHGLVEEYRGRKQLVNPSVEKELRILPVYRPIEGLPQRTHESIVQQALEYVDEICAETLPQSVMERYALMPCAQALRALHAPADMDMVARASRRFAFEQALLYQVAVRMVKELRGQSVPIPSDEGALNAFWRTLPFAPTSAQRRTLAEIAADLRAGRAMARMVQGDVGSGKTAVAMGAMLLCAKAGYQSALMAPTEILARQHYEGMREYYESRGIGCGLLLGGMSSKERKAALAAIASGAWRVVIGTHALISPGVRYERLALCVTDEQHRFGVAQRTALMRKATGPMEAPHLLVMSATPIPRSLALILFGDLDVSIIDELPPGRKPVETRIVPESKRDGLYGFVKKALDAGQRAYIVCPLVEQSESEEALKAAKPHRAALEKGPLKGYAIGLSYGSQPPEEKREALRAFAAGDTQVLVATTVIEVGVNVPQATVMLVEDADRYGLAQLHQLRGRVGRGAEQSWCFLLAKPNERLRALASTGDGFEIARMDMEQRGFGELLGTRQHGAALVPAAALGDTKLLYEATACAEELCRGGADSDDWALLRAQAEGLLGQVGSRVSIS